MLRLVKISYQSLALRGVRRYSATSSHENGNGKVGDSRHDPDGEKIEPQSDLYKPGSDSYAYENPWPKLNKGRLDWMFQDGWRRPLAKDQGGKLRREWLWFGQVAHDEHSDWAKFHQTSFLAITVLTVWLTIAFAYFRSDMPQAKEWSLREAHLEIIRREKAGLPYVGKDLIDPERVAVQLPSEEELRDIEIII